MNLQAIPENVIFRNVESNLYEDSYFYNIGVNIRTGKYFRYQYASTAYPNEEPLENSIQFNDIQDAKIKEHLQNIYEASLKEEVEIRTKMDISYARKGDKVQVTNTRAKNYKNEIFVIDEISQTYFRGQLTGTFLRDGYGLKTNINNCSVISFSKENTERMVESLKIGKL